MGESTPDIKAERRQQILDAAVKVFAARGHADTRIQDVADEAGVAYGLVYHYFGSKDALLATVFDENWATFAEMVTAVAASPRPVGARLQVVLDYALASAQVYPDRVKVILLEYGRLARLGEALGHAHVSQALRTFRGMLTEAQSAGELAPGVDPEVVPVVLLGALQAAIVAQLVDGHPLDPAAVRSTLFTVFGRLFDPPLLANALLAPEEV